MLPDYVRERTFLVATPMGSWTTQARTPWTAVRDWAASTDIRPGKMTEEVAENYWICSLVDDGKEFDVWVVDLEPEKRMPPAFDFDI